MMIEKLITGAEISPSVVIKDSLEAPGWNLLRCWSYHLAQKSSLVVELTCGVETSVIGQSNTVIIDCMGDPLGLGEETPNTNLTNFVLTQLKSHSLFTPFVTLTSTSDSSFRDSSSIVSPNDTSSFRISFIIPDLSSLFLFHPARSVLRLLDSLTRFLSSSSSTPSAVLALLHRDAFPASLTASLDYVVRTHASLHPAPGRRGDPLAFLVDVIHKSSGGKVVRSKEVAVLAPTPPLRLLSVTDVGKTTPTPQKDATQGSRPLMEKNKATSSPSSAPTTSIAYDNNPTANLTFNLSLTASEKAARGEVVLPFEKRRGGGGGRIIYEAEDEDDLDEDDPDDDLNI